MGHRLQSWIRILPAVLLLAGAPRALAQEPAPAGGEGEGWNGPRVLDLVDRAREARRALVRDGDLESYRALTEGHIYFFVDPEEGERALIRVDQVAVELRWRAPDRVQQHVVGERSETRLPVREFRYYLDRLTLVQYGFGDEIEVGSGMDVSGVPHPLAPAPGRDPEASPYDFRLADSLSVTLPGRPAPVRLYEVEVRPRDPALPGILGTLVLDRASASIVRMAFTFTPASYVDRRTDRISVELDYGLWEERYWLPNRQRIEVRRELPELDVGVGTVIRAVLRVGGYELNVPVEEMPVLGPTRVTAASREAREAYPFPEGLYDGLERHGLSDLLLEVDPRELRARAMEIMREQRMSGLAPLRFHLPRMSELVRFNRSEGVFLGVGATVRPRGDLRLRAHGGAALGDGRGRGRGSLRIDGLLGRHTRWWTSLEANKLEDLGLVQGADPLLSTLGALVRGEDYQDPYRVSAARVGLERPFGDDYVAGVTAGWERHRAMERSRSVAPLDGGRAFREVRPVEEGRFLHLGLDVRRPGIPWPGAGAGSVRLAADVRTGFACQPGSVDPPGFLGCPDRTGIGVQVGATARWGPPRGTRETRLDLDAYGWLGDALSQGHRLLGGRGTLPGYPYRSFAGRHLARASLVHAADVWGPHLRLRAGLHGGWTGNLDSGVAEAWQVAETGTLRTAGTVGVGVLWDLVRIDGARGFDGGEWQLLISLDPRWWRVL